MKNEFLKFSSKRILFSAVMASALLVGNSQIVFADTSEVRIVMQSGTIKGQIIDTNGEPVIGANVQVKGTGTGVISDINGNFAVNAASNATLVVSYIGYKTQEVALKGKNKVSITLQEDSQMLQEVVVNVGYGTQKKSTLSGSVSQVSGKETLRDKAVSNVALALQGEVPGLTITRSSSRPGNDGVDIKIRGDISVNDIKPMILIDGVEAFSWELGQMNPQDVESVSVLKDAAAAIYGTKAAGGVVLVTTKRGKEGRIKVDYSGAVHMNYVNKRLPLASISEWAQMQLQGAENDKVAVYQPQTGDWSTPAEIAPWGMFSIEDYKTLASGVVPETMYFQFLSKTLHTGDVDQFDAVYGTTFSHQHSVNISGGSDKATFRTSLGYANDRSIIKPVYDGAKKYNFRTNVDYKVNDFLKTEFNVSYDIRETMYPLNGVGHGIQDFYIFPLYNDKGQYYDDFGANNLLAKLDEGGRVNSREDIVRVGGKVTLDVSKWVKGLSFSANGNLRMRNQKKMERQTTVTMYDWDGKITSQTADKDKWVKNYRESTMFQTYGVFAAYDNTFKNHHVAATIGAVSELTNFDKLYAYRRNMADDSLDDLETGDKTTQENSGGSNAVGMVSYIGRLNYDYKGIYLLELLGRRDGSSRLHPDYRWANFGGVSAAVRLGEMDFVKQLNIFDNLKVRASYGETGSTTGIGEYDYISGIGSGTIFTGYESLPASVTTSWIKSMTSLERTWERVSTFNFGLDFAVLNNRLNGSFDYFIRKNNDMLIGITYPQILGADAPKTNSGDFTSKGWELALNWNDRIGEVGYRVGFSLADARSEVTRMEGANAIKVGKNSTVEGKPLNAIYVYRTDGILQNEDQVREYYNKYGFKSATDMGLKAGTNLPDYLSTNRLTPGCVSRVDMNGDDKINTDDLDYYGDAAPHLTFGLNLGLNWKNFDFNAFLQGVGKQYMVREGDFGVCPLGAVYQNQNKTYIENTWNTSRTDAKLPLMSANNARKAWNYKEYNDINIQNISYCRLKNISLGYTLPKSLLQKVGLERIRMYVSGDDLFVISNVRDGLDPEKGEKTTQGNTVPYSACLSFGIDVTF